MDINTLRSIATVLFFASFLWITWWAYSKKQKDSFNDAANLPFADDPLLKKTQQTHTQAVKDGEKQS